jgi:hypothetical protein
MAGSSQRWQKFAEDPERKVFIGEPVFVETLWLAAGKNMAAEIAEDLAEGTRLIIEEGVREKLRAKYFADQ